MLSSIKRKSIPAGVVYMLPPLRYYVFRFRTPFFLQFDYHPRRGMDRTWPFDGRLHAEGALHCAVSSARPCSDPCRCFFPHRRHMSPSPERKYRIYRILCVSRRTDTSCSGDICTNLFRSTTVYSSLAVLPVERRSRPYWLLQKHLLLSPVHGCLIHLFFFFPVRIPPPFFFPPSPLLPIFVPPRLIAYTPVHLRPSSCQRGISLRSALPAGYPDWHPVGACETVLGHCR